MGVLVVGKFPECVAHVLRACRTSRSRPEAWNRSALRSALKVNLSTASFNARLHRELSRRIPVLPAADPATRSRPAVLRITVYDAETRSQIATDQNRAGCGPSSSPAPTPASPSSSGSDPTSRPTHGQRWIQTIPGKGWFVYSRIYSPQGPTFNGDWTCQTSGSSKPGRPQWPRVQKLLMQFHRAGASSSRARAARREWQTDRGLLR